MPSAFSVRPFLLILSTFGLFGFMFGVWQVLLADLQQALQLSPGALGAALTTGFVASFPVMLMGGRMADRWGVRSLIAGSGMVMGIALTGLAAVEGYGALIGILLVFFAASGAFDVGINAAAIDLEQLRRRRILTWFHAAFSGFAALGALGAGGLLFAGVPFRILYIVVALLVVGLVAAVWFSWALPHRHKQPLEAGVGKGSSLYRSPAILLIAGIGAVGLLAEGAMESWSAIYLRSFLDLPAVLGASGVAVFHAAMLIGRLGAGRAVARLGRRALLRIAGALAAGGMLLALATTSAPLILSGFLIVGLALSVVVPIAFSLAGDAAPQRTGEASSIVTVLGYSGFLLGPVLIGGLAELFGLRMALVTVIAAGGLITLLSLRVSEGAK